MCPSEGARPCKNEKDKKKSKREKQSGESRTSRATKTGASSLFETRK
jgi:hypothetical protein